MNRVNAPSKKSTIGDWQLAIANVMAERVGFEPTERFPAHSISSAANSTTLAPLPEKLPIADFQLLILKNRFNAQSKEIGNRKSAMLWRRGWDLNPRWSFPHSGFRDRCTKPLCDLSAKEFRISDFGFTFRVSALFFKSAIRNSQSQIHPPRLTRKNCCINLRQSSCNTPAVTAIRWFRKSVSQMRNRDSTAPARSSVAP
jgi:hypothetical protein